MPVIGFVSQKGGVGKSTLCRGVAVAYAKAGWTVKIADLDINQATSTNWLKLRLQAANLPLVAVETMSSVALAKKLPYDLVLLDGKPSATKQTLEVAEASDMVVLPTGTSQDDLTPTLLLARELQAKGIARDRVLFVLNATGTSPLAIDDAILFLEPHGFAVARHPVSFKTGYELAQNAGRSIIETRYASLNKAADSAIQEIADHLKRIIH